MHRRSIFACGAWVSLLLLVAVPPASSQPSTPVERLQRVFPDGFAAGAIVDAAVWGREGVRLLTVTTAQRDLGFEVDDVLLAADGVWLDDDQAAWVAGSQPPVLLAMRRVPGQRPVVSPEIVGRRVLESFARLPVAERTPMRLARMVANQQTLVRTGAGIVLLPAARGKDDAAWLQYANPFPERSESALRRVEKAMRRRVTLPFRANEGTAARKAYAEGDVLEARERSSRALLRWIVDPKGRASSDDFDALVQVWIDSGAEIERRRQELLRPGPRFGVFAEAAYSFIQAPLPQNTLLIVDNSHGWAARVGVRVGIVRWLDALLTYEEQHNDFQTAAGLTKMTTRLRPVLLELLFRPVLLSRLKPVLRGGAGIYSLQASIFDDRGRKVAAPSSVELGWVVGAGIDVFYAKRARLRGTLGASFRVVTKPTFLPQCPPGSSCEAYPGWETAHNIPPGGNLDPNEPAEFLEDGVYKLDLDGFQFGFTLNRNF